MIIDVHTHMWSTETVPGFIRDYVADRADSSIESGSSILLDSMNECGIDASVAVALVYSPDPSDAEVRAINSYVRQEVAHDPSRLVGFCAVNPRSPSASAILRDELAAGARGLKFHGAMQAMNVDDQALYPLYEILQDESCPVLFHSGDIGVLPMKDRHTRATLFDAVACDFPNLSIVLGHAGRTDWMTVAGLLRKHPNVYAEISSVIGRDPQTQTRPLLRLLEHVKEWSGSVERVLFGSDSPLYSQRATLENLDLLINQLDEFDTPITRDDVVAVRDLNSGIFAKKHNLFTFQ